MSRDYASLHDPNAEYTMRDLSAETMGVTTARGGRRDVAITDVQTTMVDGNFPWTLVRIYTDAGVVGTGEAYWGAGAPELIERMKPFVVGENPLDIDRLTEHLVQKMSGEGSIGGVTVTAISGIEVALHDLAGKILEVPAYQLLGGKYRDEVRVYCDCHTADEADPIACADEAERVVDELGYDAEVQSLDFATLTDTYISGDADDYEMYILGWTGGPDPDVYFYNLFHEENAGVTQGHFYEGSDDFHDNIIDARETADQDERRELYTEVIDEIVEEVPVMPAYSEHNTIAAQEYVSDLEPHPNVSYNPQLVSDENNVHTE